MSGEPVTFGDWVESLLEGRTDLHLRRREEEGVAVWEPVDCSIHPDVLARAMWDALADNGVLRIDADSPKEMHDLVVAIVARLSELNKQVG